MTAQVISLILRTKERKNMISFEEAVNITLANKLQCSTQVAKLENSLGKVLSADVLCDRDIPPFDKSAVDGYALALGSIGKEAITVSGTIAAGQRPTGTVKPGECYKIMTGAMVPKGAECVVMVEDTELNGNQLLINRGEKGYSLWSNICLKGEDLKKGSVLLQKGTIIGPEHIAVLASAGLDEVPVVCYPKLGILSTGDELIEPGQPVEEYQIRNSNGWQLMAQANRAGFENQYFGIASDSREELENSVSRALQQCDILVMTGGVSMGEFDFVPQVLTSQGFCILFDRVAIQPGKPSTFAVKEGKVVFALPGNPVSSFVQFELLVRPYLAACAGADYSPLRLRLPLSQDYTRRNTSRTSLVPVKTEPYGSICPIIYNGSAHIHAMTCANGIMVVPSGVSGFKKGDHALTILLG